MIHNSVDATDDEQRRLIIEAAQNAMLVLDAAGTITLANAAAERLTRYAPGSLVGQHVDILDCAAIADVVPLDRVTLVCHDRRPTIRRADGSTTPLEITARRFNAACGELVLVSLNPSASVAPLTAPVRREPPLPARAERPQRWLVALRHRPRKPHLVRRSVSAARGARLGSAHDRPRASRVPSR